MTAPPVPGDDRLVLPRPLPHQLEEFESTLRFLVWRWGRRTGKSRGLYIASLAGRGPGWETGAPMYPGVLQGWDVCWIGKNNQQTAQIWLEEVLPRMKNLHGVDVNLTDRRVAIDGHGALHVRSAEAIGSIRGIGARLKGVVIDEAAWWPFMAGWRQEIRPILMDNEGWAIVASTTNAGTDGELNELGDKISPSGFNRLCEEIMLGRRTAADGWQHSHRTARENPRIKPSEFAATVKEYVPGSISLEQELEAKLVAGGAGVAFPEWRDDVHIERTEPPRDAVWFGGMDWGYDPDPCLFYAIASFGDRQLLYRHERMWRKTTPYQVGYELGQFLKRCPPLDWIGCDPSMRARTTGPSILEELNRGLVDAMKKSATVGIEAPAGEEQRRSRKLLLHEGLRFEERPAGELARENGQDPDAMGEIERERMIVPPWLRPKITFHPDCTEAITSIPKLPKSPKGKEDVDTEAYDHPYDGATYALTCRVAQNREDPRDQLEGMTRDTHPGFTKGLDRQDPWHAPKPGGREHFRTGYRYRFRRDDEEGDE